MSTVTPNRPIAGITVIRAIDPVLIRIPPPRRTMDVRRTVSRKRIEPWRRFCPLPPPWQMSRAAANSPSLPIVGSPDQCSYCLEREKMYVRGRGRSFHLEIHPAGGEDQVARMRHRTRRRAGKRSPWLRGPEDSGDRDGAAARCVVRDARGRVPDADLVDLQGRNGEGAEAVVEECFGALQENLGMRLAAGPGWDVVATCEDGVSGAQVAVHPAHGQVDLEAGT